MVLSRKAVSDNECRFRGNRLPGGDGCMAVSRTDGFSDLVRAWLVECLPRGGGDARSLVRDGNEADDLVQECVYRLLKRAGSYDLPRDGSRRLFHTITNEFINRTMRGPGMVSLEMRNEEDQPLDRKREAFFMAIPSIDLNRDASGRKPRLSP